LRELTDGTTADIAALLVEVVSAQPIAGPWKDARIVFTQSWDREASVIPTQRLRYPAFVRLAHGEQWAADVEGEGTTLHATPEAAKAHCDARLRAAGWLLL
jgi:hypothetical protein